MSDRSVPMRVIVCGLHRTGTTSIRNALKQLGFCKTYHMRSVRGQHGDHTSQWIQAFEGKYTDKRPAFGLAEWDRLLGGAQACCDLPAAVFSCELAEIYPDAKVIILNRDPEDWYLSVLHTVGRARKTQSLRDSILGLYTALFDSSTRNWKRLKDTMRACLFPYDHAEERDKAIAWFNTMYNEFRERIPVERRIEYSIKDGWLPLCQHLGVPVPMIVDKRTGEMIEAPFPRVNDTESYLQREQRMRQEAATRATYYLFRLVGQATAVGILGYSGYLVYATFLRKRGLLFLA